MGWHSIIQFYDLFLRTEYHSGLNLLSLGNDSYLLFMIFQTTSVRFSIPIKMRKELVYIQSNVRCIGFKTAKHIFYFTGTSVFECPSDSLD